MRPTRAYGRPGTAVIPADWAASHRPVAEGTMTASVDVRHPGTSQGWSDADDQNIEVPNTAYYEGPARVQALATQARPIVTVADREVVAQYLVTVPVSEAGGMYDQVELDLIDVTDSGDSALDGRTLMVVQVVRGSLLFERDLFCSLTS